jgi:hypothetical protein
MGLVGRGHDNVFTAALSLAANRAGKITHLADAGHLDLAARYLADLNADCDNFLTSHPDRPANFERSLRDAATPPPVTAPPCDIQPGQPVRLRSGLTGIMSHQNLTADRAARTVAVNVTRVSDPPHPRHGSRWTELYSAPAQSVQLISETEVQDHPAT